MTDSKPYLGIFVSNPIQHEVPLYAALSDDGRLRIKVFYFSRAGLEPYSPYGLDMLIRHEIPLLEGYDYKFLSDRLPSRTGSFRFGNSTIPSHFSEEKFSAVLIYGYNYISCWLAMLSAWRSGVPMLFRGEAESIIPRPTWKIMARKTCLPSLYNRFNGFLVMGAGNRKHYLEFGVGEDRLFDVPQSVDQDFFRNGPDESVLRRIRHELDFDEETVLFVYACKHREAKRPLDAVTAFCKLPIELNAGLLMLGDGPLREEAEKYARVNDRGNKIRFLGYCDLPRMRDYMCASDVFFLPSIENFGASLYQGIASGLAILCSDRVVAWVDTVEPGVNGFVYRAGCIDALFAHLLTIARDRSLVLRMKRASERLREKFSLPVIVDGVVQAVERFSANGGKHSSGRGPIIQ